MPVTVRLRQETVAALKAAYGTASKGARSVIEATLAAVDAAPSPPRAVETTVEVAPPLAQTHLHRRVKGEIVDYVAGAPRHRYTCSIPGCDFAVVE